MSKRVASVVIEMLAVIGIVNGCTAGIAPTITRPPPNLSTSTLGTALPTRSAPSVRTATPDVRTPASNTVEVRLSVAPGGSETSFTVRDTRGDVVFQTYWPLVQEYVIYLPPGEYTWSASAPIPTPPAECFVVVENYGFWKDGRFTAVKERIEIQVRLGHVIVYCTPTPEAR